MTSTLVDFSHSRVSAAVNFKNFVKRNWRVVDDTDKIPADDRLRIKTMIVDLMIGMPGTILSSEGARQWRKRGMG